MVANALGDWKSAIAYLKPILPQLSTIGGSHTQRDLFEQVYLDALLREETDRFMQLDMQEKSVQSGTL